MPPLDGPTFIRDFALILAAAGLAGWVCQRLGLSVVVGYLLAGVFVGPGTPPALVSSEQTVRLLADFGLCFLMFSIGQGLSLKRLRRLGLPVLAATLVGSLLMLLGTRIVGAALGWSLAESLFVAGLVMVSSSAVVSKAVEGAGLTHERTGQMALGVTVLEDMVAVVMLTVLTGFAVEGVAVSAAGGGAASGLLSQLGGFGVFVVVAGVGLILLVPRFLRLLSKRAQGELQTLLVAALLLGMASLSLSLGYSLALGAFLLGTIIAETPERTGVVRAFEGLRDVFSATFFVAIGMQVSLAALGQVWGLTLGLACWAVAGRTAAATAAQLLAGNPLRESLRAGLAVAPIGEFSFIIAQLGVSGGVLPPGAYPAAIGAALLTMLAVPPLVRVSGPLAAAAEAAVPARLRTWLELYRDLLDRVRQAQERNLLWKLLRPRLWQVAVELALACGLLIFAPLALGWGRGLLGGAAAPVWLPWVFWTGLGLLLTVPVVSLWRNFGALSLLVAECTTAGLPRERFLRPAVEIGLRVGLTGGMLVLLWALLPHGPATVAVASFAALVAVVTAVFGWRRLTRVHSALSAELRANMEGGGGGGTHPWLGPKRDWGLHLEEVVIPDGGCGAGKTVGELRLRARFGANLVSLSRQGLSVGPPSADTRLFPQDHALLLGTPEQVARARAELTRADHCVAEGDGLADITMEELAVPAGSPRAGVPLAELDLPRTAGVQIAALRRRGGVRPHNPGPRDQLQPGDEILALGCPTALAAFRRSLEPPLAPPPEAAEVAGRVARERG